MINEKQTITMFAESVADAIFRIADGGRDEFCWEGAMIIKDRLYDMYDENVDIVYVIPPSANKYTRTASERIMSNVLATFMRPEDEPGKGPYEHMVALVTKDTIYVNVDEFVPVLAMRYPNDWEWDVTCPDISSTLSSLLSNYPIGGDKEVDVTWKDTFPGGVQFVLVTDTSAPHGFRVMCRE